MKWKLAVAGLLLVSMAGIATAQNSTTNSSDFSVEKYNLSEYEEKVNQHTEDLPGWIKNLVGDQDVNIYIDQGQNDSYNISIKMDGLKVESINDSALDSPDIEVWTSTDIIEKIVESEDPVAEMRDAIDSGEIDYRANDTWTKVKLFFADLFSGLL